MVFRLHLLFKILVDIVHILQTDDFILQTTSIRARRTLCRGPAKAKCKFQLSLSQLPSLCSSTEIRMSKLLIEHTEASVSTSFPIAVFPSSGRFQEAPQSTLHRIYSSFNCWAHTVNLISSRVVVVFISSAYYGHIFPFFTCIGHFRLRLSVMHPTIENSGDWFF